MNQSKANDPRFWKRWRQSGAVGALRFNQQKHPEIQPGEVFITNADSESFRKIGWKTKRTGIVALDILGRAISQTAWHGAFPVFAQKSELTNAGVTIRHERESIRYFPLCK